jgi:hypothetical protein
MFKFNRSILQLFVCGIAVFAMQSAYAQQPIPLNDLSAFTTKSDNWKIVGNAAADISKENVLITTPGKGVLTNVRTKKASMATSMS